MRIINRQYSTAERDWLHPSAPLARPQPGLLSPSLPQLHGTTPPPRPQRPDEVPSIATPYTSRQRRSRAGPRSGNLKDSPHPLETPGPSAASRQSPSTPHHPRSSSPSSSPSSSSVFSATQHPSAAPQHPTIFLARSSIRPQSVEHGVGQHERLTKLHTLPAPSTHPTTSPTSISMSVRTRFHSTPLPLPPASSPSSLLTPRTGPLPRRPLSSTWE